MDGAVLSTMTPPIVELPVGERPRERLLAAGPASLRDAELVALVLRTGGGGRDAVALAHRLLETCGGMHGLLCQDAAALLEVRGLGEAKAAALLAVREILKRAERGVVESAPVLTSSDAVRRYLNLHLDGLERERFGALLLDTRHRLIALEDIFQGSIDRTMVYPREVVKCCLRHNAAAVVLYHNHPSGDAEPSPGDIALTNRLQSVLGEVDVRLLDHVVVARMKLVSLAERGML